MNDANIQTRPMQEEDLDRVVALDAQASGTRRSDFFRKRWQAAAGKPDVYIALVALSGSEIRGFVMAHVLAGEFGTDERFAILDGLGVDSGTRRSGVGAELVGALKVAARDRNCSELRTQAAWDQQPLLAFFASAGFSLAAVNVLERNLTED